MALTPGMRRTKGASPKGSRPGREPFFVLYAFAVTEQKNAPHIKTLRSIRPSRGGSLAAPCHRRANTSTIEIHRDHVPIPAKPCCALGRRNRIMGKHSNCTCTICDVEKYIRAELVLPGSRARYCQLVTDNSLLADFPTALDLVVEFHTCRDARDGHHLSDCIFVGLLSGPIPLHDWDYLEKILILLFTPTAHAVVRHVSCHYQFLAREDLSQLALTTLIQSLRSKTWQSQRSHFGYTVNRSLRRSLFQWAREEFQSTPQFAAQKLSEEFKVNQTAEESFERNAILRHFLNLCQEKAYLTPDEMNLLIDLKLDETVEAGISGPNGRTSNPFRQKVKRLMTKLRRIAQGSKNKSSKKTVSGY